MKFNKIFLGLGVMGFALASCSDEVEYAPAAPVNTPPVYFSMNDETQVDLEEDATYFTMKVYRQDASAAGTGKLTLNLSADNGTDASGLFTIGQIVVKETADIAADDVNLGDITDASGQPTGKANVFVPAAGQFSLMNAEGVSSADVDVNFPAGVAENDLAFYFGGVGNLKQMLNYNFDAVVAGESSPYFITSVNYDVAFTPWETIEEGPVMLRDYAILSPSTAGREIEFEVKCQKHPIKTDFFRLIRPYADCGLGTYILDVNDPNYLYINAANPSEVFFSDKNGKYKTIYDTGIEFYDGVEGSIRLGCNYCFNKLEEDLDWEGYVIPYTDLTGAGEYVNGRISFGSSLIILLPGIDFAWSSKGWTLVFPWASSEWEEIGIGEYTDGFLTQYFLNNKTITVYPTPYPVTVERHLEQPGLYRMIAPYAYGVWPSDLAVPWNVTYNVVFNCEDPNFVLVDDQIAFEDEEGTVSVLNEGFALTNYFGPQGGNRPYTKDEVIEMEYNDTFDEATGTILIKNPMIYQTDTKGNSGDFVFLTEETKKWNTPAKLVLPTEEEEGGEAEKAPKAGDVRKIDYSKALRK